MWRGSLSEHRRGDLAEFFFADLIGGTGLVQLFLELILGLSESVEMSAQDEHLVEEQMTLFLVYLVTVQVSLSGELLAIVFHIVGFLLRLKGSCPSNPVRLYLGSTILALSD